MNARPTSLGLLLKVAAVIRDQPDRVRADFLNSLADMDPLYKSELDYILAYRWVEVKVVRVFIFLPVPGINLLSF